MQYGYGRKRRWKRSGRGFQTARCLLLVAACILTLAAIPPAAHASLEGYNEAMLSFNRWFLRHLIEPVARGYNLVVPKWGQRRVTSFFANLNGPRDIINSGLQAKGRRMACHAGRFLVNSSMGVGGFFDVGYEWFGWEAAPETFDETLGRYGVPLGPYLIIPVVGDSSPRRLGGVVVDAFLDPTVWILPRYIELGRGGTTAVSGSVEYTLSGVNLLAGQMPTPGASRAEWDAYRRSRFDFPPYEVGRLNFIADERDRVDD